MPLVTPALPRRNDTRLLYGVAVCDVRSLTHDGCYKAAYTSWRNMLQRCFLASLQRKIPAYTGCSVCTDWLVFSVFEAWFDANSKPGLQLDKDILRPGNKVYCPAHCCFVPPAVNSLFGSHTRSPGAVRQGVHINAACLKPYRVKLNIDGRQTHLGGFDTLAEASRQYAKHKSEFIRKVADRELAAGSITPVVHKALYRRARLRLFTSGKEVYATCN